MMILAVTILYSCITQFLFDIPAEMAFGIILTGAALIKGITSKGLDHVFNTERTKELYRMNGCRDSILEACSLLLIFINAILIDYEPLTPLEWGVVLFLFILSYRFLFWGLTRIIKGATRNSKLL
ncbi:hypothetical protein [Rossellomorea marisflavi]|uniref:hypothetical protein n=1 Tax=Rossellomorea marisflavi TaxID=189381 RepID=UPI003458598A